MYVYVCVCACMCWDCSLGVHRTKVSLKVNIFYNDITVTITGAERERWMEGVNGGLCE